MTEVISSVGFSIFVLSEGGLVSCVMEDFEDKSSKAAEEVQQDDNKKGNSESNFPKHFNCSRTFKLCHFHMSAARAGRSHRSSLTDHQHDVAATQSFHQTLMHHHARKARITIGQGRKRFASTPCPLNLGCFHLFASFLRLDPPIPTEARWERGTITAAPRRSSDPSRNSSTLPSCSCTRCYNRCWTAYSRQRHRHHEMRISDGPRLPSSARG